MLIDTHAHYDDPVYDADREELLRELDARDIYAVDTGASLNSSRAAADIAGSYDKVYAAVGVHPSEVGELFADDERLSDTPHTDPAALEALRELTAAPKVLAIGEIGLDYHYEDGPARVLQHEAFRAQLELARELGLPIVVHSRDAAEDTLRILQETHFEGRRVDLHCYGYSAELAREFLRLGCYFGIGGVLTFKNGRKLRQVTEVVPIERLLLETDSPYLAPEPHRGTRNSSLYLPLIAQALADIKGLTVNEVAAATVDNARRFFGENIG